MSESQIAGILLVLLAAIPCYLQAAQIEKHKSYAAFNNWNPARIADEEAYGKMLCKGLRSLALVLAALGILLALNFVSGIYFILAGIFMSVLPWYYYKRKAQHLYGK